MVSAWHVGAMRRAQLGAPQYRRTGCAGSARPGTYG